MKPGPGRGPVSSETDPPDPAEARTGMGFKIHIGIASKGHKDVEPAAGRIRRAYVHAPGAIDHTERLAHILAALPTVHLSKIDPATFAAAVHFRSSFAPP